MSHDDEAHLAVQNARNALHQNRRSEARKWAEHAARLAPQMEDPWLILAAIASPNASLQFIQKALEINPNSPRAHRGMEWAMQRLREQPPESAPTQQSLTSRLPAAAAQPPAAPARSRAKPRASRRAVPLILIAIGLLVCVAAGFSAAMSPVLASIMQRAAPTQRAQPWALAFIPKPTYAAPSPLADELQPPIVIEVPATPAAEATSTEEAGATDQPMDMPTEAATDQATSEPPTAEPTWSGTLDLTYVDNTATPPGSSGPVPGDIPAGERWIDVNLTQQRVYAYAGDNVVNSFLVSTGTWLHPTVTGKYHIYIKLRYTDMSGPDYYLPNVPYTMYFFKGYGLHGTYWHHNFGVPMSHGCVNLSIPDSAWLFDFSSVGTLVNVHY